MVDDGQSNTTDVQRFRYSSADRHHFPAPAFPKEGVSWVNVATAAHGPAARSARARGVLGLLPRELAAHAAVPQGVARALRRGRAARRLGALPRLRRRRATWRPCAPRSSAWASSTPCSSTTTSGCGPHTTTRAGRRGTCGARPSERGHYLDEYHVGEGGYAETERAIQELLGVERDVLAAAAPRGRPRRAHRHPDAGPAGP